MMEWRDMGKLVVFIFSSLTAIGIGIAMMVVTYSFIIGSFEYRTWNKLHGTNYTIYDWATGADFIKRYHYPDRENVTKHEVNLNSN